MQPELELKALFLKEPEPSGYVIAATEASRRRDCNSLITAAAINLVRVWSWWTQAYNFGSSSSRFTSLAS